MNVALNVSRVAPSHHVTGSKRWEPPGPSATRSIPPIRREFLAFLMTAVGDTYRPVLQAVQRGASDSPVLSHPVRAITLRALARWMTTEALSTACSSPSPLSRLLRMNSIWVWVSWARRLSTRTSRRSSRRRWTTSRPSGPGTTGNQDQPRVVACLPHAAQPHLGLLSGLHRSWPVLLAVRATGHADGMPPV